MPPADNAISPPRTVIQLVIGLGVGGAERVVIGLAGGLPAHGIRCVIVALNDDRRLLAQYPDLQTPIYSLGIRRNPWSFFRATAALAAIVRRENADLIHAHMFHALCLALACRLLGSTRRLVFTSHRSQGFSLLRRGLIGLSRPLRAVDVLLFSSQHPQLNAARTTVIPNGVPAGPATNRADDSPAGKRRVFLAVGRLEPSKNPVALIRAFAAMRHQDCELWLAGDGPLRPAVEAAIGTLGLADRVFLLGVRQDVPALLRRADGFVMASRYEGLPLALLEAGAAGLPVVAPPVGAIPEVLGDECGYLAGVDQLHAALDAVMADPGEARQRGLRLRDKVGGHYSLEHMLQAHAGLYRDLLAESGHPDENGNDS